ncbi:MAG TPA: hypothetical protein PKD54_09650 [Pirellulaceae bacterium]|nr:hypothetical protein [Pirellulaceae bacterium]
MRIFLSAGEPSGDLHGGNLIRQLKSLVPALEATGFGGPKMRQAGCDNLFDLADLAVMFFDGLASNFKRFRQLLRQADEYFANHRVDAVILIDFPGFNWWVARAAKKRGIPVIYYGAPQLWAWAPWRIRKLRRLVDLVLCKLPFEADWFRRRGVQAQYIGHPFFDETSQVKIDQAFVQNWSADSRPTLLLLPGSRDREVQQHWPVLQSAAYQCQQHLPALRVAVGCFREEHRDLVQQDIQQRGLDFTPFVHRTPELMHVATGCLACSGSVSLELMERRVPTVIVYKLDLLKRFLKWLLLRCRYITLVNLMWTDDIEGRGLPAYDPDRAGVENVPMPEYLLTRDRTADIARRLLAWLSDESLRREQVAWLDTLALKYARPGASRQAATIVLDYLKRRQKLSARSAA